MGFITAGYSVATFISVLLVLYLLARVSIAKPLMIAVCISGLMIGLIPFTQHVLIIVLLRTMGGFFEGIYYPSADIWVSFVNLRHNRGVLFSIYGALWSMGAVFGPLVIAVVPNHIHHLFIIAVCLALSSAFGFMTSWSFKIKSSTSINAKGVLVLMMLIPLPLSLAFLTVLEKVPSIIFYH